MEITREIAKYITSATLESFSPEAVYGAKGGIMDCLGCMLAGSKEPLSDILCQFIETTEANPKPP